MIEKISIYVTRVACLLAVACAAQAGNVSFQGTFSSDDQIQLLSFSLNGPATVTMVSLGYGGGINAAGTPIAPGGFDTFLTLFAPDGSQIDTNDDGGCVNVHAGSGGCLDAWLTEDLTAGVYTLAVTESGNDPIGSLGDGFTEQGQGNFTCPPGFCDVFSDQQNGMWAVDILNVNSTGVPEPASAQLAGIALVLIAFAMWRRSTSF